MKLFLENHHHVPSPSFTSLITRHIDQLGKSQRIDIARVTVERQLDSSPPFRVSAHLSTPGPDLVAEAVDHTLRAAWNKAVARIEAEIGRRKRKRVANARSARRDGAFARGAAARRGR